MIPIDFVIEKHIIFENKKEDFPPFVILMSPHSQCKISLYGAQILSFIPHGSHDLLWLSKKAFYEKGKAIRGGIPLCFPWFASAGSPAHGFARIMPWKVVESGVDAQGNPHIKLRLQANEQTKVLWNYDFSAELFVKVSKKLEISLSITNKDDKSFSFAEAMHSYFQISDVQNVMIDGLQESIFIDSLDFNRHKAEKDAIEIDSEIDRIYINNKKSCVINDSSFNRQITISKEHSSSTVVWNPWIKKSSTMKDMQKEDYKQMICVESANVGDQKIILESGDTHTMGITIYETL